MWNRPLTGQFGNLLQGSFLRTLSGKHCIITSTSRCLLVWPSLIGMERLLDCPSSMKGSVMLIIRGKIHSILFYTASLLHAIGKAWSYWGILRSCCQSCHDCIVAGSGSLEQERTSVFNGLWIDESEKPARKLRWA